MTAAAEPIPAAFATPDRRAPTRSAAIDIARGVAIILVVWGHGIIGVQRAVEPSAAGRFAIILIYSVHMALLFFISGLLAKSTLAEPLQGFAQRVWLRIVYPYFLWSSVILFAHYMMSDLTNTKVAQFDLLGIAYRPPAVMWFLYVLFFCFLIARALRDASPRARVAIGAGLAVGGYFLDVWLLSNLRFVGIFLIATALAPRDVLHAARDRRVFALAALAVLIPGLLALRAAAQPIAGYPGLDVAYLPAAPGAIILILAAAQALERRSGRRNDAARLLAFIGTRTMPIFVTHILILAAVRIALIRLGIDDSALIIAAAVTCGVLLPILAFAIAERLSIARLLGWR